MAWDQIVLYYCSNLFMYRCGCFNIESYTIYLSLRLFSCPVSSFNRKKSLFSWRYLRWNYGGASPSPRKNETKKSWDLGSILPSWGLMSNTTKTRRSNKFSRFMQVISFMCDFGDVDELIVASLARRTWRNIENDWCFFFDVAEFG